LKPWVIAGLLSLLFPGLGQIYNRQTNKGLIARRIGESDCYPSPYLLNGRTFIQCGCKAARKNAFENSPVAKTVRNDGDYVTHDQVEAMTMADRIMVLHGGISQQIGALLDVYNHPNNTFVAPFIGSPPMNLGEAKVSENTLFLNYERAIRFSNSGLSLPEQVIVGVGPEHICSISR
jgi:hypothetical protein